VNSPGRSSRLLVHEYLVGPILYRLLLSGGPFDRKFGTRLVDGIVEGFRPRRMS
jgi:hypothetical protein